MYNLPQVTSKTTSHDDAEAVFRARLEEIGVSSMLSECELIQRSRSWGGCDVYRWRLPNGRECLVKSLQNRPFWIRLLYGQRALRKEDKNLRMLLEEGVRVPRPYGMADDNNLLEEFLADGKVLLSMRHYTEETKPSREFFKRLVDMVLTMHDHRVCHGDFHRANIMILGKEEPCLLDVVTARKITDESSWLDRRLFGIFKQADEFSLARIVETYYPDMIDDRLQAMLDREPWYLKIGPTRRMRNRHRQIRDDLGGSTPLASKFYILFL